MLSPKQKYEENRRKIRSAVEHLKRLNEELERIGKERNSVLEELIHFKVLQAELESEFDVLAEQLTERE